MPLITPTVGRVVYFNPHDRHSEMKWIDRAQPMAAIIVLVNSDTNVNLAVFDQEGKSFAVKDVTLVHDLENDLIPDAHYAHWMPYQLGQARVQSLSEDKAPGEQVSEPEADEVTSDSLTSNGLMGVVMTAASSSQSEIEAGAGAAAPGNVDANEDDLDDLDGVEDPV